MRNNFYNQGINIIAHHYFSGNSKNNLNRVRYNTIGGFNPTIVSSPLTRRQRESDDNPSGMMDGGGYQPSFTDQQGQRRQGATDQQTFVIGSMGELNSVLKGGQSGQALDLRDHQISPEVYMALARGQKVEVELQQMAPERVNLFTPLLASFMQIAGGAGGGVAYNETLSKVITGGATTGEAGGGQLGKAADFVNKYGSAYSLGLGTGEHIDVVAKFRILNEEKPKRSEEVVTIPDYVPPKKSRNPNIPEETPSSQFNEKSTTTQNVSISIEPPQTTFIERPITSSSTPPVVRTSPVDNGSPLVSKKPRMDDYNYRDPQGDGRTEDQKAHAFLSTRYKGQLGSSGQVNHLSAMPKPNQDMAQSSSTIRGLSPQSNIKNSNADNWYSKAIATGKYPVKAAEDFLSLAVKAGLITEKEFADAKGKPDDLGKLFEKVEHKLGKTRESGGYNLRESGNLGSAHIRALENALINKVQAMNTAVTLTTIVASQGEAGMDKINKYESCINGHQAEFKAIELEKDPAKREQRRNDLINKIDNELKSLGFSESERSVLKYMTPADINETNKELKDRGINLKKIASGDMTGLSDAIGTLEKDLQSVANTIESSGYDNPNLPQFQQLKSQINAITGGENSDSGSIDTLKTFVNFKTDESKSVNSSVLEKPYQAANLLNNIVQGKVPLPLSEKDKVILKDAGLDDAMISKIGNGDLNSIKEGLTSIQKSIPAKNQDGTLIEGKTNDGKTIDLSSRLSTQIGQLITNIENRATNTSKNLTNVLDEVKSFEPDKSVSETGKASLNNAMNQIAKDIASQIPKDIRDKYNLNPDNIDANKLNEFLNSPDGKNFKNSLGDSPLANNLTKFSEVKNKVDDLTSRSVLGGGREEYNLPIGAREHIGKLIQDLKNKGIDTRFLMNGDSIDYDKAVDFITKLDDIKNGKPIPADYKYKNELQKALDSDSKGNPKENTFVKQASYIKEKQLDKTQDQEAVDVITKGYKLTAKQGVVDIKTTDAQGSKVTQYASAVYINPTNLKNEDQVMKITEDFLQMAVKAGLITEKEFADAKGKPDEMYKLFVNVEKKLDDKYNGGKGRLTTDHLIGAAHITNIQRALVDKVGEIRKGAQAVDKLYEGQNLSGTQSQDLQKLIDEYNNSDDVKSGKKPKIESIEQLKNNKKLGVELLGFAAGELVKIKESITDGYSEYGQLSELKDDIDRIIGKEGTDSGILAVKEFLNSTETPSTAGNAQEYKQNLEKTLNSMKQAIANGQTTVSIDEDGDGKGDVSKPISEVLEKLEKEYEEFLLTSQSDEHGNIQTMANLFSQVYLEAGLAGSNGAYSELSSGFALALESVGNIDVDKLFGSKTGQTTVSDSNSLTHRMIGNIDIPKLQGKLDECFADGKTDHKKLAAILSSNFKNFSDKQALQFFAIAERLLKNAGINPVPDLSGEFQKAVALGKDVENAMKEVLGSAPVKEAVKTLNPPQPKPEVKISTLVPEQEEQLQTDDFDGSVKKKITEDRTTPAKPKDNTSVGGSNTPAKTNGTPTGESNTPAKTNGTSVGGSNVVTEPKDDTQETTLNSRPWKPGIDYSDGPSDNETGFPQLAFNDSILDRRGGVA